MPFISLLYRKDLDNSDVVALNLLFFFFWSFMLWNAWYLDRDFISTFRLRLHCHVILLYFQMFGLDLWSLSELFFLSHCWFFYGFDFFFLFYYRSIISLSSQQSSTLFLVLVGFQWLGICELSTYSAFWKLPFVKLNRYMEKPNIFSALLTKCWVFVRFFSFIQMINSLKLEEKKERKEKKRGAKIHWKFTIHTKRFKHFLNFLAKKI